MCGRFVLRLFGLLDGSKRKRRGTVRKQSKRSCLRTIVLSQIFADLPQIFADLNSGFRVDEPMDLGLWSEMKDEAKVEFCDGQVIEKLAASEGG